MPVHIASAIRSPFTPVEGALAGWHPVDLTAHVMNVARAGHHIDEVFVGCAEPVGAQGANMARAAILTAGWPDNIGGTVIERAATSGTAALHAAVAAVTAGEIETAMVIGVCAATMVQPGASALARTYGRPWGDGPAHRVEHEGGLLAAPSAADRAARRVGIDRVAQDEWAAGSHERRTLMSAGAVITPIAAEPGDRVAMQRGAAVTADTARERPSDLAELPPSFDPDGTVTGFTFAPAADGVAALVVSSQPVGPPILGVGRSAGHPLDPTGGIRAAVEAAMPDGVSPAAVDRWELAEPTAAATLLAIHELHIEPSRVNRAGGTLSVGDAGAAEELRLIVDGLHHAEPGELVMAAAFGPTGAAATLLRRP